MKQNLKVNAIWLAILLAGFGLIQGLVSAGILNFTTSRLFSKSVFKLSWQLV